MDNAKIERLLFMEQIMFRINFYQNHHRLGRSQKVVKVPKK